MLRKRDSPRLRLLVTLIHLALFAELGVLTRTFLDKLMLLGCDGGWGPCLQSGAYFKDLPANMLGSFIIGLFAASSTLGLATHKALALLPRTHPWQANLELQTGIRTGYCGSLTTFASWNLALVTDAVQSNQWMNAALGLFAGLFCSIQAYIVGMHAALTIDRRVLGDALVLEQRELYRESQVAFIEGLRADSGETAVQKLAEQAEPDIPRLASGRLPATLAPGLAAAPQAGLQLGMRPLRSQDLATAARTAFDPAGAAKTGGFGGAQHGAASALSTAAAAAEAGAGGTNGFGTVADGPSLGAEQHLMTRLSRRLQQRAEEEAREREWEQQQQAEEQKEEEKGEGHEGGTETLTLPGLFASLAGYRTDGAALLALVLLTAGLAVGVGLEARHEWLRQIWVACLLGPLGCVLRWWLSRWNYRAPGVWAWFPGGTFAANMLGTALAFGLQCIVERRSASLGLWGGIMVGAVQSGFCGALTTVSTLVTEIVKFSEAVPENFHAYTYTLISLAGGTALGLGIYGWSVWAA